MEILGDIEAEKRWIGGTAGAGFNEDAMKRDIRLMNEEIPS